MFSVVAWLSVGVAYGGLSGGAEAYSRTRPSARERVVQRYMSLSGGPVFNAM